MHKILRGVIHGNTIELEDDLGLSEGEQVEVVVRRVVPHGPQSGDGFLRTEGALADDKEWDAIMHEIEQSRKQERRPHTSRSAAGMMAGHWTEEDDEIFDAIYEDRKRD